MNGTGPFTAVGAPDLTRRPQFGRTARVKFHFFGESPRWDLTSCFFFHWPLEVVVVDVESFVSVEFSGRRKFFHSFDPPHSFELPFRPTDGADAGPREKQKVCHRTRCGFSVGFVYLVAASLILSLGASLPQLASVPRREVQVRAVRHASVGRGCELRGFLLVKWKWTNFFVVL